MPPSSSSPATHAAAPVHKAISVRREHRRPKKYRLIDDIYKTAKFAVLEREDYSHVICDQCGSGEHDDQLLLCDKCDKAYHMLCLRPIVVRVPIGPWFCPSCSDHHPIPVVKRFSQTKILNFFRIQKCSNASSAKRISPQDARKRRKRSGSLVLQKKRRRLLPYIPTEDADRRLKQMSSLALALTSLDLEFAGDLIYSDTFAPRSANQAMLEKGGMQVLSKEDTKTMELCKAMYSRGECPPLLVVFDQCEGYTVQADGHIKDMTFITEYTGHVDYIKNREDDDCDSMMTLLLATDPSNSLVICPDKRGNIARFINGINNHSAEGRRKRNLKCVRYSVNGESRVFLVATRDIAEGERLYYDYNGYEHEYPTHHFI